MRTAKVALINVGTSPIEDTELAHDLAHKPLQLKATLDITEPAQTHRVHHQLNVNFAPELPYDPALGRTLSKYSLY